ncbi:MAG: class I SAM-dependent methyltransferase [Acidimicrobiaceae bacterium]|nr:class I SAM-dependent methyltransferase [Acidimicrobiaceae bacterium]MXW62283.1 class I SAM-dependent methyltransferase [Acidimicrobiaceae bacterium]MXW77262.1 class I SAM-dependent methyltransferase [Acidimicrobiaceae bacterium]MYA73125.1 class I SAM-dependent methyltransferase [Acidimicrobiaceae bacterium]MYC42140.1 class I SAM-dependent methyltransferase [Acidimicrobiaceae bacterium]
MQMHDTRAPADRPIDHVDLGLGVEPTLDRRLIGYVAGRRVLELGCGQGHAAVGLAVRGARVTAIDEDVQQLRAARELAIHHETTVEFHQTQLAELAFLTADQIDLAISVTSLCYVEDLDRVIRQVHRVIKPGGHLLISLPHPAALCADPDNPALTIHPWNGDRAINGRHIHTIESIVSSLCRAKFVVDTLLERHIEDNLLPATLLTRARKP